ncbi:hypothetical protein BT96DRAFT_946295 [Gymnopus androsaceus JB14]|uniref:Uncharacterized protein n=1 Tax=Gymnopus androsaceus JB14 TaxID=1447944 RepID=A0A6A4GXL9_9AGAR|nr:hypothetical protein BT96DRAFT_946295 [Gymnopus androsaceus JB14]
MCQPFSFLLLGVQHLARDQSLAFMTNGRKRPVFMSSFKFADLTARIPSYASTTVVSGMFLTGLGAVIVKTAIFCYRPDKDSAWYIVPAALMTIESLIISTKEEKEHIMVI